MGRFRQARDVASNPTHARFDSLADSHQQMIAGSMQER
jgi:hypothetical protein